MKISGARFAPAALVLASLVAGFSISDAQEAPIDLGTLAFDEEVFWNEGRVEGPGVFSLPGGVSRLAPLLCALGQPCFDFELEVLETSSDARLRIGYDTTMRDDNFELTITDPGGNEFVRTNGNQYSVESFFDEPAIGTWTLRLVPYSAEDAPFRVRAKLESESYRPTANAQGQLLPNLQVVRMWEFGFAAPLNPLNGLFPPDDINPPASVNGTAPVSCGWDEQIEDGAQHCLRYSFGMANVGEGVFDIRWTGTPGSTEAHDMVQCIETESGPPESVPAGSGEFHETHGHWHYEDVIFHQLFRVVRDGENVSVEAAGEGKKLGYSPADQAMPDWHQFDQAASGTSGSANCAPEKLSRLGMSRGWGDAYRYQRPGNYVEFGVNGDGEYVVITEADPLNQIVETDETDNTAYTHLRITGDQIEICERGLGTSPWDPAKVVWTDWWDPQDGSGCRVVASPTLAAGALAP